MFCWTLNSLCYVLPVGLYTHSGVMVKHSWTWHSSSFKTSSGSRGEMHRCCHDVRQCQGLRAREAQWGELINNRTYPWTSKPRPAFRPLHCPPGGIQGALTALMFWLDPRHSQSWAVHDVSTISPPPSSILTIQYMQRPCVPASSGVYGSSDSFTLSSQSEAGNKQTLSCRHV